MKNFSIDETVLEELPPSNEQEHMESILREEVESAMRSQKKRKAPNVDNIPAEMIQAGEECSIDMLRMLCNRIYQEKNARPNGKSDHHTDSQEKGRNRL